MTGCICNGPGFCERHQVNKTDNWHRLCKTNKAYFEAWEKGVGPGQVAHLTDDTTYMHAPRFNSGIGDTLAARFSALDIEPIPGCPCKDVQNKLNELTPEQVLSDVTGWATKLQKSARRWKELKGGIWSIIPVPPLWLCKRVIEDACKQVKGLMSAEELTSTVE